MPDGTLSPEFSINASIAPSDNPTTVGFDGVNHLMVWSDDVGGAEASNWEVRGVWVSLEGQLAGAFFDVAAILYSEITTSVCFDGVLSLVTWFRITGQREVDVYGAVVTPEGQVSSLFELDTAIGSQVGGAFHAGEKILFLYSTATFGEDGFQNVGDSTGRFLTLGLPTVYI